MSAQQSATQQMPALMGSMTVPVLINDMPIVGSNIEIIMDEADDRLKVCSTCFVSAGST
jgi:hypothetical protein